MSDEDAGDERPAASERADVVVEVAIGEELDLHSFQPREVLSVVEEYVRACQLKGLRRVRIVHGRGRGVQRAAVRRLLLSLPEVVSASDATPAAGGWGATLVELRRS